MKKHLGTVVDLVLLGLRGQVTTVITARRSAAFLDLLTERAYFMTDSKWAPADAILTSTNATNGSGNLFVYFKDLLQPVSIYFVALLSSIVAEFEFLVYHKKENPPKWRVFANSTFVLLAKPPMAIPLVF